MPLAGDLLLHGRIDRVDAHTRAGNAVRVLDYKMMDATRLRNKLKEAGASIIGVEGEETSEWVLVDAGDIIVHVMQPAVRAYYNLEELWSARPARRTKAAKAA